MAKNRSRSTNSEPTAEEALQALKDVAAASGPYTISGNRATFTRLANVHPDQIGDESTYEFSIDGDRLTWGNVSSTGRRNEWLFKKVS